VRRLAALVLALSAATAGVALLTGGVAQGSQQGRFDVIFDDARGLVAGQLVKIAGAQAGTIVGVSVTPDFKARIQATVDSRFLPFHADATCTIRPEGLIAENYVECDPGSANRPALTAHGGTAPTVPVTRTTEPVSLLDLFNIFNDPTRERLTALVNELGISTAARGQDVNDLLRRANPSLALARQVVGILNRQRSQLATIADATSTIAAEGAGHTADVQSFLTRAAGLTALTASHRTSLAQSVQRLPALLATAQPALTKLDTVAVQGTPLVRALHAAVPSLNQVSTDLGPFVSSAKPALSKLSGAISQAIPALRDSTPLVRTLRGYADHAKAGTSETARLFENLQQHGFIENFLSVAYYIGASLSRYDSTSHLLSILLISPDNGLCGNYATTPVPACSAHYGSQPTYTPASAQAAGSHGGFGQRSGPLASLIGSTRAGVAATQHGTGRARGGAAPDGGGRGRSSGGGTATAPTGTTSPGAGTATGTATTPTTSAPSSPPGGGTLQSLAGYLLR
jgi:ABC-type transporter Mla subunit MlaD